MYCKECGAENKDNSKFCKYCGAKLNNNDNAVMADSNDIIITNKESKKSSGKKTLIMALSCSLGALLLITCIILFVFRNKISFMRDLLGIEDKIEKIVDNDGEKIKLFEDDDDNMDDVVEKDDDLIEVDGIWGIETTIKAEDVFGIDVNGIIANQPIGNQKYLPNVNTNTWDFVEKDYYIGSELIKVIQKTIGAEPDGLFGANSVLAMQKWLNVPNTGKLDEETVKAFQTYLNNN